MQSTVLLNVISKNIVCFLLVMLFLCTNLSYADKIKYDTVNNVINLDTDKQKIDNISKFIIDGLQINNVTKKEQFVDQLINSDLQDKDLVLKILVQGKLYTKDNVLYELIDNTSSKQYRTLFNQQQISKDIQPKKIIINNAIRNKIFIYQSIKDLKSEDIETRYQAVNNLINQDNDQIYQLINDSYGSEKSNKVKTIMQFYIAKHDINSENELLQIQAIKFLSKNYYVGNIELLQDLVNYTNNHKLKTEAQRAIDNLLFKQHLINGTQTLIFGLSLGSVLVIAAIGLAITFGVMGVINMAHGELIMIGAYCVYVIQTLLPNQIEYSLLIALPVAFIVSGSIGIIIERTVVRFLYGRSLDTLLATFGVSLILQQAVRSIFSPLNKMVETPTWLRGNLDIFSVISVGWNRIFIISLCLICFILINFLIKRTRLGLEVRAVTQNRNMARSMGIKDNLVDMYTFGLGAGIAGIAGVALTQLTNIGPNLGQSYIIDSFMVVVIGGVGNIWGTLLGGLGLGVLNQYLEVWFDPVLAKVLVLIFIILFIIKYPKGMFKQKGREA